MENVGKLELKDDATSGDISSSLGFSTEEVDAYSKRTLDKYINAPLINAAKAIVEIYNNDNEPFALRVFGVYALGRLIEKRFRDNRELPPLKDMIKLVKLMGKVSKKFDKNKPTQGEVK